MGSKCEEQDVCELALTHSPQVLHATTKQKCLPWAFFLGLTFFAEQNETAA